MTWKKGKCYDDITAKAVSETFSENIETCSEVGKGWVMSNSMIC